MTMKLFGTILAVLVVAAGVLVLVARDDWFGAVAVAVGATVLMVVKSPKVKAKLHRS